MNLKTLKKEKKNLKKLFFQPQQIMMMMKTIPSLTQHFFAIRFNVEQKNDLRSSAELKELVDNNRFSQLSQEKFNIILDYQKRNNQCHEVNILLAKQGYF